MSNWKKLIGEALEEENEIWGDVVSHTLSDVQLYREFDNGYGGIRGIPFTAWTTTRVYFPTNHAGKETVASVPRNPNGEITVHIGGDQ